MSHFIISVYNSERMISSICYVAVDENAMNNAATPLTPGKRSAATNVKDDIFLNWEMDISWEIRRREGESFCSIQNNTDLLEIVFVFKGGHVSTIQKWEKNHQETTMTSPEILSENVSVSYQEGVGRCLLASRDIKGIPVTWFIVRT